MRPLRGRVLFWSRDRGGRRQGPPLRSTYSATAVSFPGGEVEVLPKWIAAAKQFSIVLEFESAPFEGAWSPTTVRPLVDGAPGSEALRPGSTLLVMEGPHPVARLVVDPQGSVNANVSWGV